MTDSSLSAEDLEIITDESARYARTHERITAAVKLKTVQLRDDLQEARELTARKVAEQRDEEKQAIQSDEYVAHGLAKLRLEEATALGHLLEQPYFARVITREKDRDIEFRLGLASFPDERIIDWRKGPISKLYYDYDEGEEYDEEIQGQERHGKIVLKRGLRGHEQELSAIELATSSLVKSRGSWHRQKKNQQAQFSMRDREKIRELLASADTAAYSRLEGEDGYLPQILSLLTPEQFRLISSDTRRAVVIQGSAGTGKTTVALHRLAWLLYGGNSKARAEKSLVMVFNPALAQYVKYILPSLGVGGVCITTFRDWAREILETILQKTLRLAFDNERDPHFSRKARHATFLALQEWLGHSPDVQEPLTALQAFYAAQGIQCDSSAGLHTSALSDIDLAFLLHIVFQRDGLYRARTLPAELDMLVMDEAQDFNTAEILAVLNALEDKNNLILAGDLGQKILADRDFGSWPEMLLKVGLAGVDVLNLNIAYRSTYQIYELAEFIRDPALDHDDLHLVPRFGPEPVLTLCASLVDAIRAAQEWVEDIQLLNRQVSGAILCPSALLARDLFQSLAKLGCHGIRQGSSLHMEFSPGITIAAIADVKGLEFRNVLLFGVTEKNYPVLEARARNLLYVGVTRAEQRLDLICEDTASHLLPEFLEIRDLTQVVELESPGPEENPAGNGDNERESSHGVSGDDDQDRDDDLD